MRAKSPTMLMILLKMLVESDAFFCSINEVLGALDDLSLAMSGSGVAAGAGAA